MPDDPSHRTPDLRTDTDVPEDIRYDPDLAVHEPAEAGADSGPPSRRRSPLLLFALGLFGLAIAVYVLFGLIASEPRRATDYLDEIRLHRSDAWEAAFQLSRLLATSASARSEPRLAEDLIAAFREGRARDDDARVRRYLALSLGEVRDRRATGVLLEALADPDVQTGIYAAWALGTLGDPRGASGLIP